MIIGSPSQNVFFNNELDLSKEAEALISLYEQKNPLTPVVSEDRELDKTVNYLMSLLHKEKRSSRTHFSTIQANIENLSDSELNISKKSSFLADYSIEKMTKKDLQEPEKAIASSVDKYCLECFATETSLWHLNGTLCNTCEVKKYKSANTTTRHVKTRKKASRSINLPPKRIKRKSLSTESENSTISSTHKSCIQCFTITTPLWRYNGTLCNACGLKKSKLKNITSLSSTDDAKRNSYFEDENFGSMSGGIIDRVKQGSRLTNKGTLSDAWKETNHFI